MPLTVNLSASHTAVPGIALPEAIIVQVIPLPGSVGFPNAESKPVDVV